MTSSQHLAPQALTCVLPLRSRNRGSPSSPKHWRGSPLGCCTPCPFFLKGPRPQAFSGHWPILPNHRLGTAPALQPQDGGQGCLSPPDTAGRHAFHPASPWVLPGDVCALASPPPEPCVLQRPRLACWHAGWGCFGRRASDLGSSGGRGLRQQRAGPPWCSRLPASPARGPPPSLGAPSRHSPLGQQAGSVLTQSGNLDAYLTQGEGHVSTKTEMG